MPHTDGRYQQALGFNDGLILLSPLSAAITGDAPTITKNAAGDISWKVVNAKAPVFSFNLSEGLLVRSGYTDADLQVSNPSANSADAYPQGYPPMTGISYITPRTALRVKGLKLLSIAVIYRAGTNDLASFTARLDKTIFANNVAPNVAAVLAVGNNGLTLVAQANPYVIEIPIPAAGQVYQISDLSALWLELAPTSGAAGGSTFELYGVRMKVEFNFN